MCPLVSHMLKQFFIIHYTDFYKIKMWQKIIEACSLFVSLLHLVEKNADVN